MSKGTPTVTMRLNPSVRAQLEALAVADNKTVSEVIRDAISVYLAVKQATTKQPQ